MRSLILLSLAALSSSALSLTKVQFVVVDSLGRALPGAKVEIIDLNTRRSQILSAGFLTAKPTTAFDLAKWEAAHAGDVATIKIPVDTPITIQSQEPGVKDIYIKVTATRLKAKSNETSPGATLDKNDITKFVNTAGGDTKKLTQGQSGVASDSAGQQHIRGEHTDITYVVDGVPLPDTLSGRQGSIVVPSTIQSLEIITGGFAPEFGGQTAAVLNISTLPGSKKADEDGTIQFGSYRTANGDFTAVGPFSRGSYVFNFGSTRTDNYLEPQQPDVQTAHNHGEDLNIFGKTRFNISARDSLILTLSKNPGKLQNSNRTGLGPSFASVGQGYGFLGLRNADGTRPDIDANNQGTLGSQDIVLASQEAAGQDIYLREVSEFATLNFQHRFGSRDYGQVSVTALHSGQDVRNNNPGVDQLNLPVDSSIEFNPNATRNIHHLQLNGSYAARRGNHQFKAGFLLDAQTGHESYQLGAASRLALDALAALDPRLVPTGTFQVDENGSPVLDVNGNQVYTATSNIVPTLNVERKGAYKAVYVQDTWKSGRLAANYGARADWFNQNLNLGEPEVSKFLVSPRLNFSYAASRRTMFRWSYNKLFNTPPLAEGAIVGSPIVPEVLDQYDVSVEHELAPGQSIKAAYYVKDIRNQVDVGLLVPGSQNGLYSAVSLARGGVHGLEISYELSGRHGWDGYLNFTHSAAKPNGTDNTGEDVEEFNDHDQRVSIGAGLAYSWKNGATAAFTLNYGSGLASSVVGDGGRTPRSDFGLRLSTGDRLFRGHGGLGLDIDNLFDSRKVINFQSAFSGTRFQQGRRILLSANLKF